MQNPWAPSERVHKPARLMQPIEGSAYWYPQEFADRQKYVYALSESEISEIKDAADKVEARGLDIKHITKEDFRLPRFAATLADIRKELLEGRGFALIRGFPLEGGEVLGRDRARDIGDADFCERLVETTRAKSELGFVAVVDPCLVVLAFDPPTDHGLHGF